MLTLRFTSTVELPTTSISLENGTTITIPILPGTQIDVAAGTINASPDKDAQNDGDVMDDVEDDLNEEEVQINKRPSSESTATAPQAAGKPNGPPNHNNPHPYANQYLQYPNFAFNPNAPQFAQSQNYPHSSHFHQSPQNPHGYGSSSGPSPYSPPHYFNQPIPNAPTRTVNVKSPSKGSASQPSQDKNNKDEPSADDAETQPESENQSSTESPASDDSKSTMPTSSIPQKNQEPSKNQIPSNYVHPYYNYFNTYNPNQFYQGQLSGGKNPNIPQQYSDPNQQFNQFNPQYNPYNFQPPPNYYNNPQIPTSQNIMGSNKKKHKVKHRPNENENQPSTESNTFKHSYNRRSRPTTQRKTKPTHNSHKTEEMADNVEVVDADKDFESEE